MEKKCKRSKECWCSKSIVERMTRAKPFLIKLQNIKASDRAKFLKNSPSCLVRFLSECGLNVLKGNVQLTSTQYRDLKPHKGTLLQLSSPSITLKDRRNILLKKKQGGFFPTLIPIIASVVASFAGEAVAKAIGV